MPDPADRITRLLQADDPQAAGELLPLVYEELRRLARAQLANEKPGQTLQPTALVHEAFLRVCGGSDPGWNGRRHFFGAAAEAMRRILIEQARRKRRLRHGGDQARMPLDDADLSIEPPGVDVLVIEEAMAALEAADPRAREVVNLRYFAGLTDQQAAEVLGVSVATVERDWRFVRTFLQGALEPEGGA